MKRGVKMNVNEFANDMERTLQDFTETCAAFETIKPENLPLELQIKCVDEYIMLTNAIKKFNREIRNVIVMANILGRT